MPLEGKYGIIVKMSNIQAYILSNLLVLVLETIKQS